MRVVRRAIEFLFTRALRSRLGIALAIGVLVVGVLGAAQLFSGSAGPTTGLSNRPSEPITTVDPTAGDDGVVGSTTHPSPVTRPGTPTPEQIADRFTAAWLGGRGGGADDWHAALRPLSTPELTEELAGADPAGVPAERTTGESSLRPRTESFVEVLVPLDTGRLRLELVAPDGQWLVDAVDWERT
ncbi:hypothetical protein OOK41_04895 [Micromonospora sp. NBC_01655]|uniref:hypothetical protein n=1 Tax=Micromonospora sp. NBC_01655 TaxID=2975983 RepID=UPI00225A6756|nr:hypothetical protein [Micromonospora sp. NBC_01655]MCX4469641.1 hypothetical protein [Micromonospora sp. NBC_01655]